jgi:hypothetical protein
MGNTSIDVFNLNEPRLVKRRRTTIRAAIAMIRACERLDAHNTALPTLVADVVNILGDDEQGYAAAVRAIARDPDAFGLTA